MTTSAAPSPELFFDTLQSYQRTAALRSALELDLFTAIGDGARTAPEIAAACKGSPRGIRILCDFMTILGLITKTGEDYQLTPSSAMFLTKRSPAYLGGMVEFLNSSEIAGHFEHLTDTIRTGLKVGDSNVSDDNQVWEKFARAMMPMMMPSAQEIAAILGVGSAGAIRVLDIAAGHGIFGIVIAQQNPQAEVVAVDWKGVLKLASENAAKMGVGGRHNIIAGDAFKVEFGSGFDIALLTNFLHHFDVPTCTTLLTKVAQSLKPGGRVAVLEFVPNDDRVSPPLPASFAVQMLAGTPAGDAYTLSAFKGMLEAAGFGDIVAHPMQNPQTLIVALRDE